jgi:hypothetical protein
MYATKWYEENLSYIRNYRRMYRIDNYEKVREMEKKNHIKNKEKRNAYCRKYYHDPKNRERMLEQQKARYRIRRDEILARLKERRNQKKMASP